MKFCSKCGAQNEDTVKFCLNCGTKFEADEVKDESPQPEIQPQPFQQSPQTQPPPIQQPIQQQQYQPPQPPPQAQPPQQPQYQPPVQQYQPQPPKYTPYAAPQVMPPQAMPSTPAVNILKKMSSSALFIVAASMYTLLMIINVVKIFMDNIYTAQAYEFDFGYGYSYSSPGGTQVNGLGILFGIIVWILPALIGLGMWMHFMSAKKKSAAGLKTGGLTLISVCVIINLVFICLAMLLFIIAWVIMLIAAIGVNAGAEPMIVAGVIGIVLVVAIILVITYYAKLIGSISALKRCALTGQPKKVSAYVAVMHFITALVSIAFLVASIIITANLNNIIHDLLNEIPSELSFMSDMLESMTASMFVINPVSVIVNAAVTLLDVIVAITISIGMFSYNSKIQTLPYQPPQYQQPPAYIPNNQYPNSY